MGVLSGAQSDRRTFLRRFGCGAAAVLLGGSVADAFVEPHRMRVCQVAVSVGGLPRAFEGLRIGLLTDIHHGPTVGLAHVETAVRMLNALQPDVVALTGDYIYRGSQYIAACFGALVKLTAPLGLFGVLGNHDHWHGPDETRAAMRRAGILELTNSHCLLSRRGETLVIAGVGDLWEDVPDVGASLRGAPPDAAAILLAHNPDTNEQMNDRRVKLMLSGHTHGGQVNLPLIGPPVVPSRFGAKYASGLVRDGWKQVYVSRGIGSIFPAIRFRCRPEITLLTLRRGD